MGWECLKLNVDQKQIKRKEDMVKKTVVRREIIVRVIFDFFICGVQQRTY